MTHFPVEEQSPQAERFCGMEIPLKISQGKENSFYMFNIIKQ